MEIERGEGRREGGGEGGRIQGDCETRQTPVRLCGTPLLSPCVIVAWVEGECSLEGGESLVIVLGHPVLMSQESVSICERGADLPVARKEDQNNFYSSSCHLLAMKPVLGILNGK